MRGPPKVEVVDGWSRRAGSEEAFGVVAKRRRTAPLRCFRFRGLGLGLGVRRRRVVRFVQSVVESVGLDVVRDARLAGRASGAEAVEFYNLRVATLPEFGVAVAVAENSARSPRGGVLLNRKRIVAVFPA